VVTIADTGSGMSSETAKLVFEPFFTTKEFSGTGLGLWISKEIITRHNGTLHLRSTQNDGASGTVVTVYLPFANRHAEA
jgi:signal transduction histidine kinase